MVAIDTNSSSPPPINTHAQRCGEPDRRSAGQTVTSQGS